jgi:hypothetical protein
MIHEAAMIMTKLSRHIQNDKADTLAMDIQTIASEDVAFVVEPDDHAEKAGQEKRPII